MGNCFGRLDNKSAVQSILIFLGGSCNPTEWRAHLIEWLKRYKLCYFNPQVDNWHPGMVAMEAKAKEEADVLLFVIHPAMRNVVTLIEVPYAMAAGRHTVVHRGRGCDDQLPKMDDAAADEAIELLLDVVIPNHLASVEPANVVMCADMDAVRRHLLHLPHHVVDKVKPIFDVSVTLSLLSGVLKLLAETDANLNPVDSRCGADGDSPVVALRLHLTTDRPHLKAMMLLGACIGYVQMLVNSGTQLDDDHQRIVVCAYLDKSHVSKAWYEAHYGDGSYKDHRRGTTYLTDMYDALVRSGYSCDAHRVALFVSTNESEVNKTYKTLSGLHRKDSGYDSDHCIGLDDTD